MTCIKRVVHRIHWPVAALALALVCGPGRASHADDKSDLRRRIEDKLDDAASALERLPDDANDGALERARSLVAEARRYADDLGRIAGDDSDARRLAEDFDDRQDDFHDALDALRLLKGGQRTPEPVGGACADRDQELKRRARELALANDPDGLTLLPAEAAKVQDAVRRQLDELSRLDDKMDDWADDADDFSADGPWRRLTSTVAQVARTTYDRFRRGHDDAKRACEHVSKGVDHPEVKDALGKLSSGAAGRKQIIEQLNRDARELGSVLSRVSEDSGLGSIERARALLAEIERGVETLARTPTTDKEARLIVEKWPEGIRQLKAALPGLADLKEHQRDMDPLPDRCKALEQKLEEAIRKNGDDTDGIQEIPRFAEELAVPVRAGLARAEEQLREEQRDLSTARAISVSEGVWSSIRDAEQRDADETFQTYADGFAKTAAACANVVKGKDAPAAKAAVEKIDRTATSGGDQLTRDVETWERSARATYLADCAAKRSMWEAECGSDREPSNEESDEDAREISRRLESEMRDAMAPVLARLPELQQRVDALLAKRETKGKAAPLAAILKKERERLERLSVQGRWIGANRPYNQLATDYGKEQHVRLHKQFGCSLPKDPVKQLKFEGAEHLYPDCIIVTDRACKIIEFKSDSKKGRTLARKQLDSYQKTVPLYYSTHLKNKTAPDSDYGGQAFLDRIVAAGCAGSSGNGPIEFTTPEPGDAYYGMCAQPYQCIEGN